MVVLWVWIGLGCAMTTSAQPFETVCALGNGPANPRGNLTLGPDGNFYGTTASGGQYGDGTVFRVTTNGNLMTLASFGSFLRDGTWPYAGLTLGADGNFYGTTIAGGTNQLSGTNNTGTIFRVTTNGTLTTVTSFTGFNGSYPECQLIIGPNGSFYGTTAYGGASNAGTVFLVTTNGILTTLASFSGTNGAMPQAGLTLGLDGNFYGTTTYGGSSNVGTIFQVTPGGSLKTLVDFNNTNGAGPYGQLLLGADGSLYGTTSSGGISSGPFQVTSNSSVGVFGTVFRVTTNGMLTTLADLTMYADYGGTYAGLEASIGWNPYGQLLQGADGSFYGTTSGGGTNGTGTIFKVSTNGTLAQLASLPNLQFQFQTNFLGFVYVNYTTNNWTNSSLTLLLNTSVKKLYDFPPLVNATNSTGAESRSGLTLGPDGSFYAAVYRGGASGYGTIIRVATNGITSALASFSGNTGSGIHAGLTLGPDGSLYGATQMGGVNGMGTLFRWSRKGGLSTLHNFDYRPDGANPNSSLTLGPDGNLYGTAINGGTNLVQVGPNSYNAVSDGTVFRVTPNGVFTPVVYFNGTNGANPYGALTLLGDGNFYGTTAYGGISNSGTVFQLTTNGTLNVLGSFTGTNGSHPDGKLTAGPNGNLYGTTLFGGVSNVGTVFEISTQGIINTVLDFTGTNGANPQSGLLWNSDGYFYGTTDSGGSRKLGTVFKLTPGGALTTFVNFGQTNGSNPDGDLIKGPDGNIYGATPQGGTGYNGTVFRLNANGTMTTLFSFPSTPLNSSFSSGYRPYSGLILFTNSNFINLYGTAYGGGNNGGGTIFQVNVTTYYAVPENASSLLNPLTNNMVWSTGGVLGLLTAVATNGTAQISGSGIVFTPATNFTGTATVNYTVTDNAGGTNASFITILVTNIPPVANPDFYTVAENSSANVLSPLTNDVPITSGGILSLVRVSPTNGTAVINGTNILFTPQTNFMGTATIGYTITDNVGGTNSSLITVQVTNVPPVANPDYYAVAANTTNTFSPLVNDVVQTTGGTLSFISLSPTNGTAAISGTKVVFAPSLNFLGTATIGYTITDNVGGTNSSLITVTVTNSTSIVITSPTAGQVVSNAALTVTGTASSLASVTNVYVRLNNGSWTGATSAGGWTNWTANVTLAAGSNTVSAYAVDAYGNPSPTNSVTFDYVTNTPAVADLSLSASAVPEPVIVGSNLIYSLTVSNAGPATASGVVVSNPIPANVTFVSATGGSTPAGGSLLVNLGSLAAGATNSVQIVVQLTAAGKLTNLFQVFANETDPVLINNSVTVVSTVTNVPALPVDVALSLTAEPNSVAVGAPLTYSLTVTNNSSTTATGVVVSNTLPPNVTLLSLLPSEGSASNNAGVVTYSVGSLPNGSAATLAIVVIPNVAGSLTNTASAFSLQTDSQPTNNSVTNVTTAVSVPITNLVLTVLSAITLNPQTGLFEQRIQVANGGPATPSSVLVLISGLAVNAQVYNATGTTNGLPYVQSSSPLGVGSNVVFLLEYYVPTRVAPTNLTLTVQAGPVVIPPVVSGTILNVSRMIKLDNGSVLVEFSAVPGQVYAIQYSSDMVTWLTAVPAIAAPANRVQWIDSGPPKTVSSPAQQGARYYRAILLTSY